MPETTFATKTEPENEITEQKAPQNAWYRLPDEPVLWYNRFQRYLGMGPKRSLQAAVEQEQGTAKALESTEKKNEPAVSVKKPPKAAKSRQPEHLTPLPPAKVQVPGSWKQASIKYNWVERAQAFDAYFIDMQTQKMMATWANMGLTSTSDRVAALNQLYTATGELFNKCGEHRTKDMYLARMQAVLRDIRDEMQRYNEDFERDMVQKRQALLYITATQEKAQGSIKSMVPSLR